MKTKELKYIENIFKEIKTKYVHTFGQCNLISIDVHNLLTSYGFAGKIRSGKCSLIDKYVTIGTVNHTWNQIVYDDQIYVIDMGIHNQELWTLTFDAPVMAMIQKTQNYKEFTFFDIGISDLIFRYSWVE